MTIRRLYSVSGISVEIIGNKSESIGVEGRPVSLTLFKETLTMSRVLMMLAPALLIVVSGAAAPDSRIPPIQKIKNTRPIKTTFKGPSPTNPLVLKSEKDAAKYFDKANLARLKKQVDFTKQYVLVFAWQGSSGDQLRFNVAESFPEQIHFLYKRGFTDDLKQHVHVYALRSNVKWRVRLLR